MIISGQDLFYSEDIISSPYQWKRAEELMQEFWATLKEGQDSKDLLHDGWALPVLSGPRGKDKISVHLCLSMDYDDKVAPSVFEETPEAEVIHGEEGRLQDLFLFARDLHGYPAFPFSLEDLILSMEKLLQEN